MSDTSKPITDHQGCSGPLMPTGRATEKQAACVDRSDPITPSERHLQAARGCIVPKEWSPDVPLTVARIAAALANAEREGMKRAAEIAKAQFTIASVVKKKNGEPYLSGFLAISVARRIEYAILSQVNPHSPDTPPVEANTAGEADNPSRPVSPATHFPWRGRGFNPDEVK